MKIFKALMGLLFLGTMASSQAVILESCSWDHPGVNPYKGTVNDAIDHYRDLSPELREKFKQRVDKKQFDEVVTITRDQITGVQLYEPNITDMHFGGKTTKTELCLTTSRSKWAPTRKEMGLVYCEGETCILIPNICNNVSRIKRLPDAGITTGAHSGEGGNEAQAVAEQLAEGGGGGGGGGGGSVSEPSQITTGSGETQNSLVSNNSGSTFHPFTPWNPIDYGGGGGGCCWVVTPPVTPPIVVPPPVPEPSEWAMMLCGVAFVLLFAVLNKPRK